MYTQREKRILTIKNDAMNNKSFILLVSVPFTAIEGVDRESLVIINHSSRNILCGAGLASSLDNGAISIVFDT